MKGAATHPAPIDRSLTVGAMTRSVDVMILCAGLGTRLRPLTLERPKPAVPLLNRPLIGYTLGLVQGLRPGRVIINTHWLPDVMAAVAAEECRPRGFELAVSPEPQILGTGGGLWQARERGLIDRNHALVVLNGDVICDVDLPALVATHFESRAAATMVLRTMPPGAGYTPIEADPSGRILRIGALGKSAGGEGFLFSGVHVLSPEALDLVPPGESSVIATAYAGLLARDSRVQAVFENGLWLDLGDPAGYLGAHLAFLRGKVPARSLARLGLPSSPVAVSPDARVDPSARIDETVVGAGARIGAGARVRRSVLWPGASVSAGESLDGVIVTPRARARVDEAVLA